MDDKIEEKCKTSEKQCMQEDLNRSRGVEMLSSQPRWIKKLSRSYRGSGRNLDRSTLLLRSCRDCLKIVFQEGKNTDMNATKHATQPRIQSTY